MMNAKAQETLFAKLGTDHPDWSREKRSGYVHGTNDAGTRREPNPSYLDQDGAYAVGYMLGWRDHDEE